MFLEEFLGNLNDTDAWGDRFAREMSLVDEVVSMETNVIRDSALLGLLTFDGV
jgi:hypothetical protein